MLLPSFPGWPHTPGPGPELPAAAVAPAGEQNWQLHQRHVLGIMALINKHQEAGGHCRPFGDKPTSLGTNKAVWRLISSGQVK